MADDAANDFEEFATSCAKELFGLAYLLTGHRQAAEYLTQDALLAIYRQWPKVQAAERPTAYAKRVLTNCHLGGYRRRRVTEISGLELRDVNSSTAEFDPAAALDERDEMWVALSGLTERQRAVLVLRYYEAMSDHEIAAALRWRPASVRSTATRALARSTEDLVRQTLRRHQVDDYDATDLLRRVRHDIGRGQVGAGRPPLPARALIAVGAATVLVAAGIGWWVEPEQSTSGQADAAQPAGGLDAPLGGTDSTSAVPPTASGDLVAPGGMKYVGYQDLMIAVPQTWKQSTGCSIYPAAAVIYPQSRDRDIPCAKPIPPASVIFKRSIVGPAVLLGRTIPAGEIDGQQLLVTPVRRRGDQFEQILALPTEQFYLTVQAPQRAIVQQIVASAQGVPEGYAAVPPLESMAVGRISAALREAGLRTRPKVVELGLGPRGTHVVGTQLPPVGTVVPESSQVRVESP